MTRSRPLVSFVAPLLALALATAAPAFAQEAPKDGAAAASDTHAGRRFVTVRYATGGSVRGVAAAGVLWEKRDANGAWVAAKAGERDASVRLHYVGGMDGVFVVPASRIKEVVVEGPCSDDEFASLRKSLADASAKAAEDRKRIAAEKAAAKAAEEKAAAEKAAADAAAAAKAAAEKAAAEKVAPTPADTTPPAAPADTVTAEVRKRRTELLEKYPPARWTPDTPATIQRRFIVRHLPATREEREFLAVFEEWRPAYEEWKKAQPAELAQPAPSAK